MNSAPKLVVPPKLVVTDMDGTLLGRDGLVSARNAAALRRAQEAGAKVLIATGRPVWWLDPVRQAGFAGTAVCMNGAMVYHVGDGEVLAASPLSAETLNAFTEAFTAEVPGAAIAVERLGTEQIDSWSEAHYDHPWDEGSFEVQARSELLAQPAIKMLVRYGNDSSALAAVAAGLGVPGVSITYSTDAGLIEVMAGGVNKGVTVARLAQEWGIDPADAVAFGDMPNDIEMLQWAGRSYAMEGAHTQALAAATDQAGRHDEDGVAQVLERWF
ncbi:HAD family hydrolase [Nakamurella sp. A5-74]|uniref:HAD family hydrolase n=1 Tax=Nakamurella sp. A5-74 TaxID=3158264 RepID=A0AAU8DQ11_9ACTN